MRIDGSTKNFSGVFACFKDYNRKLPLDGTDNCKLSMDLLFKQFQICKYKNKCRSVSCIPVFLIIVSRHSREKRQTMKDWLTLLFT